MLILIPFGIGFLVYLVGIFWLLPDLSPSSDSDTQQGIFILLMVPYFAGVYYFMNYLKSRQEKTSNSEEKKVEQNERTRHTHEKAAEEENMDNSTSSKPKRGGCLSIFLIVSMIAYPLTAVYYFFASETIEQFLPNFPSWLILIFGLMALADFVFVIGIWNWKKWGVYGLAVTILIAIVINSFNVGLLAASSGLIGLAFLAYLVRDVWPYMEGFDIQKKQDIAGDNDNEYFGSTFFNSLANNSSEDKLTSLEWALIIILVVLVVFVIGFLLLS